MVFYKIYKPYILSRYSLFLKNNKNNKNQIQIKEEYDMIRFLNITTPIWTEATIVLILTDIIFIPFNLRVIFIISFILVNYIISKMILSSLRKHSYVELTIKEFNISNKKNLRYKDFWYCAFIISAFTLVPFIPLVIYFLLK